MTSSAPNPDAENAALRAALAEERAARTRAEAEIEHLKLLIAKLRRERYGQSSERGSPPSGSAGTAAGGDGDSGGREHEPGRSRRRRRYHGARLHPPQAQAGAAAGRPAAGAGRAALARGLPLLWWRRSGQAGGRRHGDAGGGAQAVEGGADGAGEVQLPGLRGHHPAAGTAPCHRARARRPEPAGDDRLRQVRHAPAAHPAEPGLRGRGHRARRLDAG